MTPILPVSVECRRDISRTVALAAGCAFVAGFAVGSVAPNGLRVAWAMPVAVPSIAYKAGEHLCEHWGKLLDLVPLGNSRYHFICHRHAVFRDIAVHTKSE